jgi:site-specific DNA recombinase
MKTAIQYIRISREDQSRYSLPAQREANERWCKENGLEIIKTYEDNGQSASSFNRKAWRELEAFLKRNRNSISAVVVANYDRLIRNAAEGLSFLEKVETRWNVRVISSTQMSFIPVNPWDPFFFKMRADMLVNAEFELRMIRHRTKRGVWKARKDGRFIGRAPWHYRNAKDEKGRPVLEIIPERAKVVEQIGMDYLNGMGLSQIMERAKKKGYPKTGHSAIKRELSNPVNGGLVKVPPFEGQPSHLTKGIHQGVWPEAIFWKIQEKLSKQDGPTSVTECHELPLRGVVSCSDCSYPMTGGKSKSKTGRYYWYYRCDKCKPASNHNWNKTHRLLCDVLDQMSLPQELIEKTKQKVVEKINARKSITERQYKDLQKESSKAALKLDKLEEKFIQDEIAPETYRKWRGVYVREIDDLKAKLEQLDKPIQYDLSGIDHLLNLTELWRSAPVSLKQSLAKVLFPGGLYLFRGSFKSSLEPLLPFQNPDKIRGFQLFDNLEHLKTPISTGNGSELEPLLVRIAPLLSLIRQYRA